MLRSSGPKEDREAWPARIGDAFGLPFFIRNTLLLEEWAKAVIYPSKFEGFGLPVAVEAIVLGTPVVCSDIDSLKEVGGDAVSTFDPEDSGSIVRAVEKVLLDSQFRDSQLTKAKNRKSIFTAVSNASKAFNLYRELVEADRRGPCYSLAKVSVRAIQGTGAAKAFSTGIVVSISRAGSL